MITNDQDEWKQELWSKIVEDALSRSQYSRKNGEITMDEFTEKMKDIMSPHKARRYLQLLVNENKIATRWFTDVSGKRYRLYLPK
jgi:hypothetical protein